MASLLLPIIYLAFISLGLPDALLGVRLSAAGQRLRPAKSVLHTTACCFWTKCPNINAIRWNRSDSPWKTRKSRYRACNAPSIIPQTLCLSQVLKFSPNSKPFFEKGRAYYQIPFFPMITDILILFTLKLYYISSISKHILRKFHFASFLIFH